MTDFLLNVYPWVKALHVISVIAWMAGLFYLPRLFVYHVEKGDTPEIDSLFQTMEFKLLRVIMNPAMISSWIFGLVLVLTPGVIDWSLLWPWAKALAVIAMTVFHHWLGVRRKVFTAGFNELLGKHYRMMNEVPTVLLVIIVVSVITKAF